MTLHKSSSSGIWGLFYGSRLKSQCHEDSVRHQFSLQSSKVKLLCSEYALALVGAVGRNINVHLLTCGSHEFCFTCIWNSHFPFGFEFYHDAELMEEVTASIKSFSQVQKGPRWTQNYFRKQTMDSTALAAGKLISCFSLCSAFACNWWVHHNCSQPNFARCLHPVQSWALSEHPNAAV